MTPSLKIRPVAALAAALSLALPGSCNAAQSQPECFSTWPPGKSPAEIGKRIAENFLPRQFRFEREPARAKDGFIYPEAIAWYGSLTVADLTGDKALKERLIHKFDPFLTEPGIQHISQRDHVDYRVFGMLPMELYIQTRDERYLRIGKPLADAQWEKTTPDGITTEARYWIDDMYMITLVQVQAYRATGDATYIDRAALAMSSYFDRLQKENGLFHHGENAPFFWGRGNGWMSAGSAELLRSLPKDHPKRERILAGYRKMMAALLKYQGPDGLWRQLVDKPDSWPETSGSAMFVFGMITGVRNGWLDAETYGPAARKGWLALTDMLDENANLREICVGTNKGTDEKFYLDRPRTAGDLHGQSPMLWSASALMR